MIGARFGRLVVIARLGAEYRHSLWLCRCTCGHQCEVRGANLKSGHTKSCGCLRDDGHSHSAATKARLSILRRARVRQTAQRMEVHHAA
jgi:hypothetical protein